jgi:hypothetical protein
MKKYIEVQICILVWWNLMAGYLIQENQKKKKNYKMRPNKAGKEADLKGFSSQSPSLYVQMKSPLA